MKHTPGPWDQSANKVQILEYNGGKGPYRLIAEAWHGVQITGSGNSGIDREEAEANARLIAAAPQLLEALKKAKETIFALHGTSGWDIYDRCSPEMKIINNAIAKAEGKS